MLHTYGKIFVLTCTNRDTWRHPGKKVIYTYIEIGLLFGPVVYWLTRLAHSRDVLGSNSRSGEDKMGLSS